jgi:hypothetical protein
MSRSLEKPRSQSSHAYQAYANLRTLTQLARRAWKRYAKQEASMAKMVKTKSSTKGDTEGGSTKSKVLKMKSKAQAEAEAPAEKKKAKAPPIRKFTGKTTGKSVILFQNDLMKANFKAKLTDEQLAAAMRKEFPTAIAYTVSHVRGIRGAWNKGKHSNEIPVKPLPEYDAQGNIVPARKFGPPKRKSEDGSGPAKKTKKVKPPVEEEDEEEVEEDEDEEEPEEDEDEEEAEEEDEDEDDDE